MHVAVDLDDVTLQFITGVLECFYVEFGERIEYTGDPWGPEIVAFYHHPAFKEAGYKDWWDWLRHRDWLWATFPAVPGAIAGISKLRSAGHYVEAVTSKPEWAEPQVFRWLGKWRPAFNRVTIITNGQRKVDFTDAEVIIDDKLQTCEEFVEHARSAIWFRRTVPLMVPPGISVAYGWNMVTQAVEEIAHASV